MARPAAPPALGDVATSPTRRALLTSGAAAALIASTAAATMPAADPDAALLTLGEDWRRANKATDAALGLVEQVERRAFARWPAFPVFERWTDDWQSYADEYARVSRQRVAIEEEEGRKAAEAERNKASAAESAIVDTIAATPARTMAGLRLKIEVSADWNHDHEDMTVSIVADVLAFAAAHPALTL